MHDCVGLGYCPMRWPALLLRAGLRNRLFLGGCTRNAASSSKAECQTSSLASVLRAKSARRACQLPSLKFKPARTTSAVIEGMPCGPAEDRPDRDPGTAFLAAAL